MDGAKAADSYWKTFVMSVPYGQVSWERMIGAVEDVRNRLLRAAAALEGAGVLYAVAGGNAIAAHVSKVDRAAVRNTCQVDIIIRRADLPQARAAMEGAGFVYVKSMDVEMFLDGPESSPRDAVHLLFAGEKVKPTYSQPVPDVTQAETAEGFRVLRIEPLVGMKTMSFRDKDRTNLGDLIDLGLLDASWVSRLPPELGERLQQLLDTPEG